jgi:hypothetical protein
MSASCQKLTLALQENVFDRATDALGAAIIYARLSGGRAERSSLLSAIKVRPRRVCPLYARY